MHDLRQLVQWAKHNHILEVDAIDLYYLVQLRYRQAVASCNGDPYPSILDAGKSVNADRWSRDEDVTIQQINRVGQKYNLKYDAGTGLWGSFLKNGCYISPMPDCTVSDEGEN